ncbi:hypothetical protein SLEP1_g41888 [Rubroshorea leprosula]|uniref:NAD-dependent epimerase/dehydratase domain-containing protein n=1 Tax=Rubroshorea leprosula TaxID=152421 RepID=A0AAV5L7Y7_9ROSI|nr:hypothetical protein SLEP1_g41888 [Rubroshorea leprosula]
MVKDRVCVTGAGGFLASWVVKLLLSKDYAVHGTVRQPGDEKYAHLNKLEKASENLELFKADLLDYDSLYSAIEGCDGVFHVASPVPSTTVSNPEACLSICIPYTVKLALVEVIEPAVKGTLNVLKACLEAKIKRVVVVSAGAAVAFNPRWPKDQIKDETCWSDKEYCKTTKNWYFLSKTEAESEALEFAKSTGLGVITVCPTLILGPILQPTINASSSFLIKILKEGCASLENRNLMIVDIRDVADALILAYEKPEAEGRYICTAHQIKLRDVVDKLRSLYPNYHYPKSFTVGEEGMLSSEKLQKLGDEKYAHLNKLDKASENLKVFKAELLDYESLYSAIEDCSGVFHVASPVPLTSVPNPEASVCPYCGINFVNLALLASGSMPL